MTHSDDLTESCDISWVKDLVGFYSFLADVETAWKGSLDDVRTSTPASVEQLLALTRPYEPIVSPEAMRLPVFIVNTLRRIEDKSPLLFDRGLGRIRQSKFNSAIVDDLDNPSELARVLRMEAVFSRYQRKDLEFFSRMIDLEIAAFDTSFFSEAHLKSIAPGTALFAVGVAAAWSAFAGYFLGIDLLSSAWASFTKWLSTALGTWGKAASWGIFGLGLLYIVGWSGVRHGNLRQKLRLGRVKRILQLHLSARVAGPA